MIEWKPEALNAALSATTDECPEGLQYVIIRGLSAMKFNHPSIESVDLMLSALDAAVKAQGCPKLPDCKTYADRAYADGRDDALEEAAEYMEKTLPHLSLQEYAAAIRALKEKKL